MGHPGWDLYLIVIDPAHAPADDGAGPYLTREQRAMVTADAGLDKLDLWFDRALTATTAADIFKGDED